MNFRSLFLLILLGAMGSCDSDTGMGVDIRINIAQDLEEEIQIVSAVAEKPGPLNAVDTTITLLNRGDSVHQVLLKGSWLDANGGTRGGASSVIFFQPGQQQVFRAGTRSKIVSVFSLSVSTTQSTQDELLTQSLADNKVQIAEGYGMTYTETPSNQAIPPWTLRGVANGEPFQAKTIMFRQDMPPKWRLSISDHEFDVLRGAGYARYSQKDLQSIYIDFLEEPSAGDLFEQEMSYGGGYFQIKPSPSANSTTSWNTSIAYVIEITKWDKEASRTKSCNPLQEITGAASGRLYISFKGSDIVDTGPKDSWLSGTFENAPIVYCKKEE